MRDYIFGYLLIGVFLFYVRARSRTHRERLIYRMELARFKKGLGPACYYIIRVLSFIGQCVLWAPMEFVRIIMQAVHNRRDI